jgi:hypothetical protein
MMTLLAFLLQEWRDIFCESKITGSLSRLRSLRRRQENAKDRKNTEDVHRCAPFSDALNDG